MFTISRKRLIGAGVIAAAGTAAIGGTALAAHSSSSPLTATTAASQGSPSPSASPGATAKHGGRHGGAEWMLKLGKVTDVSTSSITVVDAAGASTTYAVGPKVKVVNFNRQPEDLKAIQTGELVVVFGGHPHHDGRKGQGASTPSPSAAQPSATQPVAVAIEDTGFKAG